MKTIFFLLLAICFSGYAFSQSDYYGSSSSVEGFIDGYDQTIPILSKPFPNPVKISTKINYNLPSGINRGVLVIFNLLGNEVKRIHIDKTQKYVTIKASDFKNGTYFYQLEYSGTYTGTLRMIIDK